MDSLMRIGEVSEWLGVPKSAIYERTRKGVIPCYKVGKYLVFSKSELEHWLQQFRQGGEIVDEPARIP